ncbi:branched-chain amino acid ABC transporter permease, partial [Candidatus Poribacteria bacterium]|nr:branched-chain amino acid ABC transporter permease [Candidatus Poribacteria bacterium]
MEQLLQGVFDGIALGSRYSLIVLGFVVIYRATGIINFAQGGFLLIGAFLTYNFSQTWGWNFYLSLFLSMIVTSIIAILIQLLLLHRSLKEITAGGFCLLIWSVSFYNGNTHLVSLIIGLIAGVFIYFLVRGLEIRFGSSQSNELPIFGSIIVTIGILFVIKQVVPSIWGFAEINMGDPWGFKIIKAGDLVFTHAKLWTIALTAIALLGFFLVNRYTKIGIAMQASSQNQLAAYYVGIPVARINTMIWAISGAVCAIAGILLAPVTFVHSNMGFIGLKAFPAAVVGGFGSVPGAVVGGLIIGIVEALAGFYMAEGFKDVAAYIVVLIVLLIK